MVQFHGSINTELYTLIWKSWAPAKCKFFAWLVVQDRLWTADRLARRGWPNQRLCPLCHSTDESLGHLLAHCQYSQRIWSAVRTWTEGQFPDPSGWASFESMSIWWRAVGKAEGMPIKAIGSLTILVTWELWKERNARIFQRHHSTAERLIAEIKEEARTWCLAGAKRLKEIFSRVVL